MANGEIRIKDILETATPADVSSSNCLFVLDTPTVTKRVPYTSITKALATVGDVYDLIMKVRELARTFEGYYSAVDPQTLGATLNTDHLWIQGSGDTLPTSFPITGVQKWSNGAWIAAPNYTPNYNELWTNLNNERGYYWFGTKWNLDDVYADGVTLEVDATGHIRIIIEGVAWQYLSPQVKDLIKRPFMVSATVLAATLSIKLTKDYSGLYLIETDGTTVLRSSALTYDGNFFSASSLPNIDNQYQYYVSPQTATQTFDATLVYWQYVPGLLEINTGEDSAATNHNVLSSVGLQSSAMEAKTQTIIAGGNAEIDQYGGNIVLAAAQDRTPINTTSSLTAAIGAQTVISDSTFDATPVLWARVRDANGTFGVIKNINAGNVTVVTVQADNDKLEKWFPANPFAPAVTGYTGYHSYNTTTGGALFERIVNGAVTASFEMDGKNPLLETSTQAVTGNPNPSIIVELFGKGDAKPGTAETFEAAGLYWCDTSEAAVIWHKLGGLPSSPHKIYVDYNYTDSVVTGSEFEPYKTLQAAIDANANGNTSVFIVKIGSNVTEEITIPAALTNSNIVAEHDVEGQFRQTISNNITIEGTEIGIRGFEITGVLNIGNGGDTVAYIENCAIAGAITANTTKWAELKDCEAENDIINAAGTLYIKGGDVENSKQIIIDGGSVAATGTRNINVVNNGGEFNCQDCSFFVPAGSTYAYSVPTGVSGAVSILSSGTTIQPAGNYAPISILSGDFAIGNAFDFGLQGSNFTGGVDISSGLVKHQPQLKASDGTTDLAADTAVYDKQEVDQLIAAAGNTGTIGVYTYGKTLTATANPPLVFSHTVTLVDGGLGYAADDAVTIDGVACTVDTVDGSGTILTLSVDGDDSNNVNSTGAAVSGGTGTGAIADIDSTLVSPALNATLFDFETNQLYTNNGTIWIATGSPIVPADTNRIDILKWLDGISATDVTMTDADGFATYFDTAWKFFCDAVGTKDVFGQTIKVKLDGSKDVADIVAPASITEDSTKFAPSTTTEFLDFNQEVMSKINFLNTANDSEKPLPVINAPTSNYTTNIKAQMTALGYKMGDTGVFQLRNASNMGLALNYGLLIIYWHNTDELYMIVTPYGSFNVSYSGPYTSDTVTPAWTPGNGAMVPDFAHPGATLISAPDMSAVVPDNGFIWVALDFDAVAGSGYYSLSTYINGLQVGYAFSAITGSYPIYSYKGITFATIPVCKGDTVTLTAYKSDVSVVPTLFTCVIQFIPPKVIQVPTSNDVITVPAGSFITMAADFDNTVNSSAVVIAGHVLCLGHQHYKNNTATDGNPVTIGTTTYKPATYTTFAVATVLSAFIHIDLAGNIGYHGPVIPAGTDLIVYGSYITAD